MACPVSTTRLARGGPPIRLRRPCNPCSSSSAGRRRFCGGRVSVRSCPDRRHRHAPCSALVSRRWNGGLPERGKQLLKAHAIHHIGECNVTGCGGCGPPPLSPKSRACTRAHTHTHTHNVGAFPGSLSAPLTAFPPRGRLSTALSPWMLGSGDGCCGTAIRAVAVPIAAPFHAPTRHRGRSVCVSRVQMRDGPGAAQRSFLPLGRIGPLTAQPFTAAGNGGWKDEPVPATAHADALMLDGALC
mmetsp:Transcript_4938/g.12013  ORF Transcript_4938/g.12013 Transcript_4938/m.12013 type:complete len:243 (+) Transcript_4938:1926-2654(+)